MKLASFRYRDRDRIGFSVDGFLVDLADAGFVLAGAFLGLLEGFRQG